MNLYFIGRGLVAKIKVPYGMTPAQVDALMAKDGFRRCTRQEYLQAKTELDELKTKA